MSKQWPEIKNHGARMTHATLSMVLLNTDWPNTRIPEEAAKQLTRAIYQAGLSPLKLPAKKENHK